MFCVLVLNILLIKLQFSIRPPVIIQPKLLEDEADEKLWVPDILSTSTKKGKLLSIVSS